MQNDDTPSGILDQILDFQPYECEVSVCLASVSEPGNPKYQRLSITDDLSDEFRSITSSKIATLKKSNSKGNLVVQPYENSCRLESHEVESIDLSQLQFVASQISVLNEPVSIDLFENDQSFRQALKFYVVVFQPKKSEIPPLYSFRKYNQASEISGDRKSHWFGAMLSKDHYDKVSEPFFLFDRQIDCFSFNKEILILNKNNFQQIFSFFDIVQSKAKETLAFINTKIAIHNPDLLESTCIGNLSMMLKLNNIASKDYLNRISGTEIQKLLGEFPGLGIELIDGKIVFDPKNKWNLLRLLDDGFLSSGLTENQYEVSSKRPYRRANKKL